MERRDSKKNNSRDNNGSNNKQQKSSKDREKRDESDGFYGMADERKRKCTGGGGGGAVSRSKPCREIYRPPSVRKGRGSDGGQDYGGLVVGGGAGSSNHAQSAPLRPSGGGGNNRPFNVYAKEFQYAPRPGHLTYSRSQSITYYPNPSNNDYYQNPILASSGCYPLQQSKSQGNLNNFYQLWAQQAVQQQQQQQSSKVANNSGNNSNGGGGRKRNPNSISEASPTGGGVIESSAESQYFALQQSKSSGNIPNGNRLQRTASKTVRFDFQQQVSSALTSHENRILKMQRDLEFAEQDLERLRISEGLGGDPRSHGPQPDMGPVVPPPHQQLQKSHTFLALPGPMNKSEEARPSPTIKRSKSYTPSSLNPAHHAPALLANISVASDFNIRRWPKAIQESVTTAVIGADRIPARHRINMVGSVFSTMLSSRVTDGRLKAPLEEDSDDSALELITSAVNIFLYFIQREKDRTVMETVINTCFATFQQIQKVSSQNYESLQNDSKEEINLDSNDKWTIFLQFLSSMYAKVKIVKLQKSQLGINKCIEEMNNSLLSLLCDSCLMTLKCPLFHTFHIMDLVFSIMTTIGREMEATFPLKMKQILAAVRDALLGVKPYVAGMEVSSRSVQKTLMQLIELHAANWHLPASAVRYYYANP